MNRTVFLFSGQGSQAPGMMKELYASSEAAKAVFNTADHVLGRSISGLCFNGTQEELNLTYNTQPCMLAVDLAVNAAVQEHGIKPDALAGFSLGEYAALVAANVISVEDAFRIIQIRADAMQEAVPVGRGAMAAIMKVSASDVEELCNAVDGYVIPANYNSPVQTVVSGESEAMDKLLVLAKERKVRAVKLPVSAPFHCMLMEPARRKLEQVFYDTLFHEASVPVYMNIDGKVHIDAEDIKACLLRQTVSPVQWIETILNVYKAGVTRFIELGYGHTLVGFVSKILPEAVFANVESIETLNNTISLLKDSI